MIRTLGLLASLLAVTTAVLVACTSKPPPAPPATTFVWKTDPNATACLIGRGDEMKTHDPCPTGTQYVTKILPTLSVPYTTTAAP